MSISTHTTRHAFSKKVYITPMQSELQYKMKIPRFGKLKCVNFSATQHHVNGIHTVSYASVLTSRSRTIAKHKKKTFVEVKGEDICRPKR